MGRAYTGRVMRVEVYIPAKRSLVAKAEALIKASPKGYVNSMTFVEGTGRKIPESVISKKESIAKLKLEQMEQIFNLGEELDVLRKTNKREVVTLRTTLIHFLKDSYPSSLIAKAFGRDHTYVRKCSIRYLSMKHYPDYQQATAEVIRCLRRHSLADFHQEKP